MANTLEHAPILTTLGIQYIYILSNKKIQIEVFASIKNLRKILSSIEEKNSEKLIVQFTHCINLPAIYI